jgi:DmsE family decaheme c-type cytochrome
MRRVGNWAVAMATLTMLASVGLSALTGSAAPGVSGTPHQPATAATAQPAAPPQAPAPGYVGADTCVGCHSGYDATVAATKHGFTANARTPMATQGCESCHGPGEAHVNDPEKVKPVQFARVSAQEANARCVTCHNRGEHALWDGSQHENRNVKCADCHSVHASQGATLMRARTQQMTCARCHQTISNRQQRFNHMPVREGKMQCSSCHNVHGSVNVKLLRAGTTVDQSCTSCHTEKRGPFLWEHAPVVDSCTTCHDSHGSNNDRMLVAKLPFLCQRCHVTSRHPPTVYEGSTLMTSQNANKIYGKACANCHQQVHGSNHPNGKFFLR